MRLIGHDGAVLYQDRQRACSFGADPERYDRFRPTYPAALIDHLLGTSPGPVLDVGCGTGIVSRLLAARGCRVLGVEPDERMAAVARRHGIEVEPGTFEAWEPQGRTFDLVTSGQAWHWVDPEVGASKAGSVLRPGGRLAVFWNIGNMPPEVRTKLDEVYRVHAPGLDRYSVVLGNGGKERPSGAMTALRASERFASVDVRSFPHDVTYTTQAWIEHLPTHSDHATLDPNRRARLLAAAEEVIAGLGGSFVMHYDCWLVEARVG